MLVSIITSSSPSNVTNFHRSIPKTMHEADSVSLPCAVCQGESLALQALHSHWMVMGSTCLGEVQSHSMAMGSQGLSLAYGAREGTPIRKASHPKKTHLNLKASEILWFISSFNKSSEFTLMNHYWLLMPPNYYRTLKKFLLTFMLNLEKQ